MSLTQGAYRVHSLFQKIIPMPYAVDFPNKQIIKCVNHQKRFYKLFRISVFLLVFIFFIPFCVSRFIWLFNHWKSYTVYQVDEMIFYMFHITATIIFLSACWTQHKKLKEIQFLLNQRCKLIPFSTEHYASSKILDVVNFSSRLLYISKSSVKEIFIYCLSGASFIVIFGVSASPFAITYDPVQLIIGRSTIPTKVFAACFTRH